MNKIWRNDMIISKSERFNAVFLYKINLQKSVSSHYYSVLNKNEIISISLFINEGKYVETISHKSMSG